MIYTTWVCVNCKLEHRTQKALPNRYHPCPKLHGLSAPMVRAGTAAKVEAHERQDYINGDRVLLDSRGRPIMSIVTTRDNGQDCVVFAPTATASAEVSKTRGKVATGAGVATASVRR